jgi:hypothetical protein
MLRGLVDDGNVLEPASVDRQGDLSEVASYNGELPDTLR